MRCCARTTMMMLALAARSSAPQVVCSLPPSALYILDGSAPVACAASASSILSTKCQTACSCRRLEHDWNLYGVCLNVSANFDCSAAKNATLCAQAAASSYLGAAFTSASAADIDDALANSDRGGLMVWQWALIGLALAIVVGLLIFIFNWFKHRPQRGDNRREVVQSLEQSHSQHKDDVNMLSVELRESQARTTTSNRESAARSTTRSHDTNKSQTSVFSGESYHTYAGNPMSSTLTDTEIVVQHQKRVFSPISDSAHSVGSSDYSQGVDGNTTPKSALLGPTRAQDNSSDLEAYPSFSSYSVSSDMDSFSSELTDDGSDMETSENAPYPRKKSIEF